MATLWRKKCIDGRQPCGRTPRPRRGRCLNTLVSIRSSCIVQLLHSSQRRRTTRDVSLLGTKLPRCSPQTRASSRRAICVGIKGCDTRFCSRPVETRCCDSKPAHEVYLLKRVLQRPTTPGG